LRVIEWTNDFALGIDEIDEQHRTLVGMINALDASTHRDSGPETMRRLLAQLGDYVRDHFGLEERLMGGGGCSPELIGRHFSEHAYFSGVLRDLTTDFEKGRRNVTVPLIEYLVHWFLHHIVVIDRSMANQLTAAGHDMAARVAAARLHRAIDGLTESERFLLAERLSREQAP
jgi:hemerythrin